VYNLFDKYVYVLPDTALLPRMALPCNETRDATLAGVVAVLVRTVRAAVVPVARDTVLFVAARDTTARPVFAAVARDVVFVVAARDATVRLVAAPPAVAVRATVAEPVVPRGLARPERDVAVPARVAWGVAPVAPTGAIGSANTARMDTNVEHTKNAAANKKTVPIAFLQKSPILRLFINYSPAIPDPRKTAVSQAYQKFDTPLVELIISFFICPVNKKTGHPVITIPIENRRHLGYNTGMKHILTSLIIITAGAPAMAADNPMFGAAHQNAIAIHAAQGTGSGSLFKLADPLLWKIEPMTMLMVQYSQPMTIFRLPARQNLNIVQNIGYESDRGLSFVGVGISWDVALLNWRGWYLGGGLGPYMRDSHDRYVESRLVFGEKFFVGYQFDDAWRAEFFTLHFSNGDFTEINRGFNFTGINISFSF